MTNERETALEAKVKDLTEALAVAERARDIMTDKWAGLVSEHVESLDEFETTGRNLEEELRAARALARAKDRQLRLQQEVNLAYHKRLEAVDELCSELTGTDVRDGAIYECGERLAKVLQWDGDAPSLPYPDAVHAAFHWRDQKRSDGLYEALCGDGYGFLYATKTKIGLTFDCAGVHACADIPYEQLKADPPGRGTDTHDPVVH